MPTLCKYRSFVGNIALPRVSGVFYLVLGTYSAWCQCWQVRFVNKYLFAVTVHNKLLFLLVHSFSWRVASILWAKGLSLCPLMLHYLLMHSKKAAKSALWMCGYSIWTDHNLLCNLPFFLFILCGSRNTQHSSLEAITAKAARRESKNRI